jgi:hypothetical protein
MSPTELTDGSTKLSLGNVNAVASGYGSHRSVAEDAESKVEDYDPVFAAKPSPFDDAFFAAASQKTPGQESQPIACPSHAQTLKLQLEEAQCSLL